MALADHLPVIDDRRFDDLVAEARTRIPRYTREWTDFNDGDLGFALVELFAWLGELLLFRMNEVPELNYIKFLELIGIELEPARPATAYLTFPLDAASTAAFVEVRARTQVAGAEPDASGPVIFETERRLLALKAELDAVRAFAGGVYQDLGAQNAAPGEPWQPFGASGDPDHALALGFAYDAEFPAQI